MKQRGTRIQSLTAIGTLASAAIACSGGVGTNEPTPIPVTPGATETAPSVVPTATAGDPLDPTSPLDPTNPLDPAPVDGPVAAVPTGCEAPPPIARRVRALSGQQYENTIAALLSNTAELTNPHLFSDRSARFSNASSLRRFDVNTTQIVQDNARSAAETIAAQSIGSRPCLAEGDATCVGDFVREIGRDLYREPVPEEDVGKLIGLFDNAATALGSESATTMVLRAMLSSPRFLFRKELGQLDPATGAYTLTPHEAASALAYTLTDAPPDETLNAAADAATDPRVLLQEQAPRLLAAASGRVGMNTFIQEWLAIQSFETIEKDPDIFPEFNDEVRDSLLNDFKLTVDATLSSAQPNFAQMLMNPNYAVGDEAAELLGWDNSGVGADGTLAAPETGRLGLLTHPVVLGTYSHEDESNPVARGHLVSGTVLCVTIPAPPIEVAFPERPEDGMPRTLRQVLEEIHNEPSCVGCHTLMDPMGFPFEVFDAVGRLRDTDNGLPIDPSGQIVGTGELDGPFTDVQDMLGKIADSPYAQACFAENAFKYVAGTGDDPQIDCRVSGLAEGFTNSGGNIPQLFVDTLMSDAFLQRSEPDL